MSIVFVFDKPEHLPPPRALVHEKRAKGKFTPYDNLEQLIDDNQPVPHDKEYASLLTGNEFKCKMIRYISNKLVEKCTHDSNHVNKFHNRFTIITRHSSHHKRKDEHYRVKHGEGDVGVWHHCVNHKKM